MGVLLILMTIGGLVVAGILLSFSWVTKKIWLRNFTLGCIAAWFFFYTTMLFGSSLLSSEKFLSINEAKQYCGFYLDCHMHTSVTGVCKAKILGDLTAGGEFYIARVKVFTDARRAKLGLLAVDAAAIDESRNRYERDLAAEAQLPSQPSFETLISPSQSFEKEIVFDLPADVQNPRLDLREGYGIDHLIEAILVDDEDSLFHKRNYFNLTEQNLTAGVK